MQNPAEALHALYSRWRTGAQEGTLSGAMVVDIDSEEGIAEVRHAYALLDLVDRELSRIERDGKRVGLYRRQAVGWARVPLFRAAGWNQPIQPDDILRSAMLDEIEGCALFLDGKLRTFHDEERPALRALIDDVDDELTDSELPHGLMSYLRRLTAEIRYALDNDAAGQAFDFADATDRLSAALHAAFVQAPEKERGRWAKHLRDFGIGVTSSIAVEAATAVFTAITSGSVS